MYVCMYIQNTIVAVDLMWTTQGHRFDSGPYGSLSVLEDILELLGDLQIYSFFVFSK